MVNSERNLTLSRQVVEGLRFVVRDPYLRAMVSYAALVNFALLGYQAVQIVFLVRTVGVGSFAVGLLVAAGSMGGVIERQRRPRMRDVERRHDQVVRPG